MHEKIGTLELEDRDQIQNKEPIFSILEDNHRLFSVERSPTKDANLMLNKVRCKSPTVAAKCHTQDTCHQLFDSFLFALLVLEVYALNCESHTLEYDHKVLCQEKFPVQHQPCFWSVGALFLLAGSLGPDCASLIKAFRTSESREGILMK